MQHVHEDSLPSGLIQLDDHDQIVGVNRWVTEWSGVGPDNLVGQPYRAVVRAPVQPGGAQIEFLPAMADIIHTDGTMWPVLVAEGQPDAEGQRYVTLFDARAQRAFRERIYADHSLTQRTRTRLELVIGASIAFAEATTETELSEVLAATTASAYSAEEAAVFLFDDELVVRRVAGSNPFPTVDDESLVSQALGIRAVVKIAGLDEAHAISPVIGAAFEASGVQSMIIAPIHQGDQPLGLLAAFFHYPRQFDDQASPLADALAGQAARAMSALRLQQRLEHAAMHDDTTGLPNRRLLEERMEAARAAGSLLLGVLFIDLDGFKKVNDRLGHLTGDRVLREVAARLQGTVRSEDVVARYGGDEFVIVCEVASEHDAYEMAERVRDSIRAPYAFLPSDFIIGASIGVSVTREASVIAATDRLVRFADHAMYQAKRAGGNQIVSAALD